MSNPKESPFIGDRLLATNKWLVVTILSLLSFIIFSDFLLFNKAYLFQDIGSDSITVFYAYCINAAKQVANHGIPSWSFEIGMGQNSLSSAFYDPFDVFLFFCGKSSIAFLIGYKEAIKIVFIGLVFFKYLRCFSLPYLLCLLGACLFAFSGYPIVGTCWGLTSFEVLTFSLLLLGFEKLHRKDSYWLFTFAVFCVGIARPINLIIFSYIMGLYATYRFAQTQNFQWGEYFKFSMRLIAFAVIGVLISCPILLEHLDVIWNSPRVSGGYSYSHILLRNAIFSLTDGAQFGTAVMRSFASDILGSGSDFRGWYNILEAPMFYSGIPCLLLAPQAFSAANAKQRRWFYLFVGLALLGILFPFFRHLFWLYTGDYYRTFCLFVSTLMIGLSLISLRELIQNQRLNVRLLIITVSVWFVLSLYPYFENENAVSTTLSLITKALMLAYGTLFYFMGKKQDTRLQLAFLAILFIELCTFSYITVNNRDHLTAEELSQKSGFNDYTMDVLDYLKKTDVSFYRMDKNYTSGPTSHACFNDALVQGYYGTSCYNSFNQGHYIKYLKCLGIIHGKNEFETRWAVGLNDHPILQGINSVKYLCIKKGTESHTRPSHEIVGQFGDVLLLKHKFALPLGFCYKNVIPLSNFVQYDTKMRSKICLKAAVVNDEVKSHFRELPFLDKLDLIELSNFNGDIYAALTESLRRETFQISFFTPTFIQGNIKINSPRILYFSIPFDKGWNITDAHRNSFPIYAIADGMMGVYLPAGEHQLTLKFTSRHFNRGLWLAALGILIFAGWCGYLKIGGQKGLNRTGGCFLGI